MNGITKEALKNLKAEMPYKWKVQTAKSWGCDVVAYIDSRQVQDLLDSAVGAENWQDNYKDVSGKVYCELSINVDGQWITKSDVGSPSAFDPEKGQASDAFKRAAVKWGVGRFLYDLKIVKTKSIEIGSDYAGKPKYAPADERGKRIYNITAFVNALQGNSSEQLALPSQKEEIKISCKALNWSGEMLKQYLQRSKLSWKTLTRDQAKKLLVELEQMQVQAEQHTQPDQAAQVGLQKPAPTQAKLSKKAELVSEINRGIADKLATYTNPDELDLAVDAMQSFIADKFGVTMLPKDPEEVEALNMNKLKSLLTRVQGFSEGGK